MQLKDIVNGLLELLFPMRCVHCGAVLQGDERFLCKSCESELPLTYFADFEENLVTKIFWGRLPVKYGYSYLHFEKHTAVQSILHSMKYKHKQDLAFYMGQKIGEKLLQIDFPLDFDAFLPVPLHPQKLKLRGYNQAEVLARGIASIVNKDVIANAVIRKVFTQTQTKLNKEQRWQNVQNIFEVVKPDKLQEKHIVMIDDVLTTGATLESLGSVLLQVENLQLSFITLATAKTL